jgi:hypothetical protein
MAAKMKNGGIGGSNSINGGIEEKWRQNGENSLAALAAYGGNKQLENIGGMAAAAEKAWRRHNQRQLRR